MRNIDMDTISFMMEMNKLAEKSKNGLMPFSEATYENKDTYIFYDPDTPKNNGYAIVGDCFIDDLHHDIICFDDDWAVVKPEAFDEDECTDASDYYIEYTQGDWVIIIDNGNILLCR